MKFQPCEAILNLGDQELLCYLEMGHEGHHKSDCGTTWEPSIEQSSPNAQGGYKHEDNVDHPKHYLTSTGIETIDVIESFELGFHLGNAVKYLLRAGKKENQPADQDIEKAIWYLRRWLKQQRNP